MFALLLGTALLIVTAAASAGLLRVVRAPGPGVIGGILAGVLLGPTIAGRFAPATWERVFVGGETERVERDRLLGVVQAGEVVGPERAGTPEPQPGT